MDLFRAIILPAELWMAFWAWVFGMEYVSGPMDENGEIQDGRN